VTYEDARRKARALFGPNAEAWHEERGGSCCCLGVTLKGIRALLGSGQSWEAAFDSIRVTAVTDALTEQEN
jgi:hypothetical protein